MWDGCCNSLPYLDVASFSGGLLVLFCGKHSRLVAPRTRVCQLRTCLAFLSRDVAWNSQSCVPWNCTLSWEIVGNDTQMIGPCSHKLLIELRKFCPTTLETWVRSLLYSVWIECSEFGSVFHDSSSKSFSAARGLGLCAAVFIFHCLLSNRRTRT